MNASKRGKQQMRGLSLGMGLMAAATIAASFVITGCSHVAPYERGILAHPTMSPDDMSTGVDEHVRAVSEGATGGFGGGGGGCGCN
jgi:hypothetical protein